MPYDLRMGVLRRFLTGDVIEPDELAGYTADGVLLRAILQWATTS